MSGHSPFAVRRAYWIRLITGSLVMSAFTRVAIHAKNQLLATRTREVFPHWPGTSTPREGPNCSKMPATQTGTPILLLAISAPERGRLRRRTRTSRGRN